MSAKFKHRGEAIDYTPSVAVAANEIVVQGNLVGIAERAISAGQLGALHTEGVYDCDKVAGAVTAGEDIFVITEGDDTGKVTKDATTNVSSGGASSGLETVSNVFLGRAVLAAGAADATVRVKLGR